jgi:prolipoprotein diacylglyceryltransferase
MLLVIAFALGMALGWQRAARRGGDRRDRLQYGAVHGIIFVLVAVIATVIAGRAGLI